jgi:hypothetical protein
MWRARAILGVGIAALLLVVSGAIVASATQTPATHDSARIHGGWGEGSRSTYNVTFNETGLPAGTNWTVQVSGIWGGWGLWGHWGHHHSARQTSNGTSLNFTLPNGTYFYRAQAPQGFVTTDGQGFFTISGAAPAPIVIAFTPLVTYSVTFSETGLPSGTNWTVAVSGGWDWWGGYSGPRYQIETSDASTITFQLANGSYRYHVGYVSGFAANASDGWFVVNGTSPGTISVNFTALVTYTVAFNETGLPANTNWSVQVFGFQSGHGGSFETTATSSTANITFTLPNGTYFYQIERVPGFMVPRGESFGMFQVSGASPPEITVEFIQGYSH